MNNVRICSGLLLFTALLAAAQSPSIAAGGILNAADYTTSVAPGGMVSIFGSNLARATTAATTVPLPKTLEGVTVELQEANGPWNALPLYFVSAGQINVQLPFLTAATAQVRVRTPAGTSTSAAVTLSVRAPRIFTRTQDGRGEPTLFHANFTWVSTSSPAVPTEYLVLLLTGLGAVTPAKEAGFPGGDNAANGPLNTLAEPVYVSFGGIEVPAAFAGLMPGFPGVYQINFQVPATIPAGMDDLRVRIGTALSQLNVAAAASRFPTGAITSIIAPTGGSISTAGASITLPAGIFTEPTTIALASLSAASTPVETWRASEAYTLYGLPETLSAPITVTLDLTRQQASGQTLVAMSSGRSVLSSGLEFLEATVTGNKATVTLPSAEAGGANEVRAATRDDSRAAASGPEVSLYVMTFYRQVTIGDFMLFFPSATVKEADVTAIADFLQQTKTKLTTFGLDWSRRTRWPMRVIIYPFTGADVDKWGMAEPSILGLNYHAISLNANKLSAGVTTELKASVAHELFHIQQNLYDPRGAYRVAKSPGSWLWFQEAASTWFEGVALGNRETVPSTVDTNYPFLTRHGLEYQPGDATAVQDHGYGAAMFLQYLQRHAGGDAIIGSILKAGLLRAQGLLANPLRWPTEAAAAELTGMLPEHWRNFVQAYTEGDIYSSGFPQHDKIFGQLQDRIVFSAETTPGKTFSWTAPDLSAAFFLARFQAWPQGTKLNITLGDPGGEARLLIYRIHGDTWTLVRSLSNGDYDFPNPNDLVTQGDSLLLVAANANGSGRYTGTTPLQIGINKSVDILKQLQSTTQFNHTIYATFIYSNSSIPQPSLGGTFFGLTGVTWKGTTFSATADDSALVNPGEPPYQVTITGQVSPDGLKLLNLHFKRYRLYDKTGPDAIGTVFRTYEERNYEWDVVGPIPVSVPSNGFTAATKTFFYSATGAAAGAAMSNYSMTVSYYSGLASNFSPSKLTTYTATATFPAEDRYRVELTLYQ